MKKMVRKLLLLVTSGLLIATQTVASADVKKVGRTSGATVINTILSGKGAPAASLGNNGDFYIDRVNMNFYGPKTNGVWPLPTSMRGPVGPSGVDGKNGADGKAGQTTIAAGGGGASTPGPQGAAGPKGDTGDKGDVGPVGPTGPAGSPGPAGTTGASGATGPIGPAGPQGPKGDSGSQGIQGVQGPKGEAGAIANVAVKYGDIPFTNPTNLLVGELSSGSFGDFALGKFYLVNIFVTAHATSNEAMSLKFSFYGVNIPLFYTVTTGPSGADGTEKINSTIHAIALVDGSALGVTTLKAQVTNYSPLSSNFSPVNMTVTGNYVMTEVGSISQVL